MNLIDILVSLVIMSLFTFVVGGTIGSASNYSYITKYNDNAYSIVEKTGNILKLYKKDTVVNKYNHNNKNEAKKEFLNKFLGENISTLTVDDYTIEHKDYICYNYYIENNNIFLKQEINKNINIDIYGDNYYLTDFTGENEDVKFLNIICMYNAYNNDGNTGSINKGNSPMDFIIYSMYKDRNSKMNIIDIKQTIYF